MPRRPARRAVRRPTLARAIAYRNDQIVYKFMESWDVSFADAEDLFTETKKLIWVMHCAGELGHRFVIDDPLRILDEMWHTFVLFTREYGAYCTKTFGRFLHHAPTTKREKDAIVARMKRDRPGFLREMRAREDRQWEIVEAELGEATVIKWYVELPLKFPQRFFDTAAKPLQMDWKPPAELARLVKVKPRGRAAPLRA